MELQNLLVQHDAGVATILINRPEARNALDNQTWLELDDLIKRMADDDDVKVIILTGAGDKAFAAGADLKYLKERTMLETFKGRNQRILSDLENLPKPVIAAINGYALGGGCELALACDIRIASQTAKLGLPETGLAVLPGAGGTQRLCRLVGVGKAKELIFTGSIIDAAEAERIGMVNKVVPPGELMSTVNQMARKIMEKGPIAITVAKQVINMGAATDLQAALALEKLGQTILFGTKDRMEGMEAFLEKRNPVYQGK